MTLLILCLALMLAPVQRGREVQVNLVPAPPPPDRPFDASRSYGSCVSVVSDGPKVPKALKATLAATDRLAYSVGDPIIFSVVLENIGSAPIVLGISRDPEVAPKTVPSCRVARPGVYFQVSLAAVTTLGKTPIASGHAYFGSPDVAGTTVVLPPGERARVQLPAQVLPGPWMRSTLTTEPRATRLHAFVVVEGAASLMEYSDNALEVDLAVRQPAPGTAKR